MNICVFGSASKNIDKKFIEMGEKLGESLAKRGHKLVYGAGSTGMMGAVARGFKKGNGKVLGIIPKFFEEKGYEVPKCLTNTYYILASGAADQAEIDQFNKLFQYVMGLDSTLEAFAKINQYPYALTQEEGVANFNDSNKSYYDVSVAAGILADARK
jgi:hypothetical protein